MAKHHHASDSELEESENSENSSSGEEEIPSSNEVKKGITEYEKQRLLRIAENKARIEALGLRKMASSFMGSLQKSTQQKGKRKVVDDDEDYKPDADDDVYDDDDEEEDEDFVGGQSSSKSPRNKVKNKGSKPKKIPLQRHFGSADYIHEDDDELMQAIALSLQDSAKDATVKEIKGNAHIQEDVGRKKRKKSFNSRVQMTEDELILHFFQFDEAGRGTITIGDLQRVAGDHDFTWTDRELADMIHCFDADGDGKLNLDDFRKIVGRCKMIQGSENY